jgi:hypothetical protein
MIVEALVRRLSSLAIILVLLLPLAAPALADSIAANIPICCRAHGVHKCMMHPADTSGSPKVGAHCPMQNQQAAPGHAVDWLAGRESLDHAETPVSAMRVRQVEAGFRISFCRYRQKRGPPSVQIS